MAQAGCTPTTSATPCDAGTAFQAVVPAGCWFAAERVAGYAGGYSLVGCTVAPGFEFSEFELADAAALAAAHPHHAEVIARLAPRPPSRGPVAATAGLTASLPTFAGKFYA